MVVLFEFRVAKSGRSRAIEWARSEFSGAQAGHSARAGEDGNFQSHLGTNLPCLSPAMVARVGRSWHG